MNHNYQTGDKVQYLNSDGKWVIGTIHGIQTHETASGVITAQTFLIDTGEKIMSEATILAKNGEEVAKPYNTGQPEQVTLNADQIRPHG